MTPHTSIFDANSALNLGASDALPFLTGMDALMETDSTGFVLAPIAHFDSPLGENLFLGETLAFSPVEDDLAASVSGDLVGSSQTLLPTSAGDSLTHSDSDHSNPVAAAVAQVQQSLQSWRNSSNFASGVRTVYGNGVNVAQAAVELDNLLSASGAISKLQVVDSLGSAEGAYAAANDTIYLSEKFVSNPNQTVDDITRVIIEELGHALDVRLNEADTAGDEGALFAAEVMGEKLSATERAAIAVEDDSATVVIDDQELAIEQSASNMDALILISGERRLADDNAAVQARLEQLGFTVSVKQVTGTTVYNQNGSVDYFSSFDRSDTDGMELIVATGFTSPPKTEIDGLEIPVLLTSQASLDEFDMVAEPTGLSGSNFSRYFELHEHPITTGVSLEDISLYKNSVHEPVGFSLPAASAKSILTVDLSGFGQPEYSSIFAYEQGDRLFNGQIAAARRVSFLGLHDGIVNLSDFGWQLFDNSVNWAVGASTDTSGGSSFGITFALSNDTGDDDSDRITSDPTIAGQLNDTAGLTTFEARLGNSGEYLDILHELQPDGSFVLDLADLETLNGGLLGSGDYTLQVRAGNASEVSDPASFDFTYEPDTEAMGLSQETINLALSEFGFDLATVNFSTIVLEDETVIVRTEDNRDIILPRYGRASFGGGGSFGGFGGGYGGGGSGFRPWVAFNYNRPSSSGGSSNPGDPTPPPEEGIYIQSIDGNGFRVIYDRVDLAGDAFVHKPKTIETAFGNINFFYHDQANSTQGIAKGDFSYTDDPEVFEVLLAAVGAQSVDDLSDIFVTGPFTQSEALAKEEAERVKTISDLWTRMGYIGISPNLGIQDLNLTTEERKQLLDFQENLLKATALTDEFARFGREEDALLLGEMTQLARVYAALDPQLEENIGGSSGGSSSPPPVEDIDVLLVSQYRLTPGEQLMVDRLSADGFNVTSKWSGHFQKSDVEDQELVIITGNIFSSDSVLDDLAVPIISLQTIMLDELDIRPVGSNGGNSAVSARGDTITISSPDHPLAGGFSGDVEIFNPDSNGSIHFLRPTEDAVEIATFSSSSGMESSPILGYEKGANLLNGETAPERRVAFIPYFQFEKFNENGWQLFDAAVDWAAGLEEEEKDPKQFQSTTVLDFFANTIWKAGNLEQSTINEFKEEFTDFSEVAIDSTIGVDYLGKLFFVLNETDATKETRGKRPSDELSG